MAHYSAMWVPHGEWQNCGMRNFARQVGGDEGCILIAFKDGFGVMTCLLRAKVELHHQHCLL